MPAASPPTVVILGRGRAHEVLLLAVSVVVGVAYTVGAPRPGSIAAELHPIVFRGWAAAMLVTGAAGLAGCFWRTRIETALGVERGAMVGQFGALIVYAAVIVAYAGVHGLIGAAIVVGWAVANLIRAGQITGDLRRLNRPAA